MTHYEEESQEHVTEAMKTILSELNGGNRKLIADAVTETLRREHRTLQQAFWSTMILAQIKYADFQYDLRNEAAVEHAKKVKELAVATNVDMGLPFI